MKKILQVKDDKIHYIFKISIFFMILPTKSLYIYCHLLNKTRTICLIMTFLDKFKGKTTMLTK